MVQELGIAFVFGFGHKARFFKAFDLRHSAFMDGNLHGSKAQPGNLRANDAEPSLITAWRCVVCCCFVFTHNN